MLRTATLTIEAFPHRSSMRQPCYSIKMSIQHLKSDTYRYVQFFPIEVDSITLQ